MKNPELITLQIIKLFETYPDMTPEEIAAEQNVAIDFVRATLMTKSELFRNIHKAKEAKREYISEDELHEFYDNLKALARFTESDIVKEKCLSRLIDDARGRLDKKPVEETAGMRNNINIIQIMLDRAKANKEIALTPEIKELVNA